MKRELLRLESLKPTVGSEVRMTKRMDVRQDERPGVQPRLLEPIITKKSAARTFQSPSIRSLFSSIRPRHISLWPSGRGWPVQAV